MKTIVALVLAAAAGVTAFEARIEDGDEPACAGVSSRLRHITHSMMGKLKGFHEHCIQYNDDEESMNEMMKIVERVSRRFLSSARRMCNKRNRRRFSVEDACHDYVELNVEEDEMADQPTNPKQANFTTTQNSTQGCQPGKTWFRPRFTNSSQVDIELLVRHHPRIQLCNHLIQDITLQHSKIPNDPTAKPSKLTFNVTFTEMCRDKMSCMVEIKQLQCDKKNEGDVVYKVQGFKDICPKRSMCEPAQFPVQKEEDLESFGGNVDGGEQTVRDTKP